MSVDTEVASSPFSASLARRDLFVSLAFLGLIIAVALAGLAHDGNWRKVLRISVAFVLYSGVLVLLVRLVTRAAAGEFSLPFWIFAVAAAAAEAGSGWLRPDWRVSDTLVLPLAAALLIGGFHWFALRAWRPLRRRLTANHHIAHESPSRDPWSS